MRKITGNLFFCIGLLLECVILFGAAIPDASAQPSSPPDIQVSGHVRDARGNAIIGASVTLENSQKGIMTDQNGYYSISGLPSDGTLVFTYLGMTTLKMEINGRHTINVTLEESLMLVDEVVVTAYATQKRINVTGAISTVGGQELTSIPVSNIANALIGNTPGVSGLQSSGEPGRNAANIRIRGVSTFGDSSPLIVIDGIEQNSEDAYSQFNMMDSNEILGISVLKDASSTAVYGIKGANGVIIVTTKRGTTSKPVINFSTNFGITQAHNLQKGLSSYDWAYMRNEAIRHEIDAYNSSVTQYIYSQTELWKMKNNRDFTPAEVDAMNLTPAQKAALKNSPALYYGSLDSYKDQFGHYGPQMQHNLNISGGSKWLRYFASLGYFQQNGITRNDEYYGANTGSKYDRYNYRANLDIDVLKNLKVSFNFSGQFGKSTGPGYVDDPFDMEKRYTKIMQFIYESNPLMNPGFVDGRLIQKLAGEEGGPQNPLALKTADQVEGTNAVYTLFKSGFSEVYNSLLNNTIKIEHELDYITKGLVLHGTLNFQDNYDRVVARTPSIPDYRVQRSLKDPNILEFFGGERWSEAFSSRGDRNRTQIYADAGLNWAGSFGEHSVSGLVLGKLDKYWLPWDPSGTNTPSTMLGLVGRVTYDYASRYMVELNAGYNGTEQFAAGRRFGFFPAFSVGWVPSNEPFFPQNDWFTFLKIRASYGEVGNDKFGDYQLGAKRRYLYLPNTYLTGQPGYWWGNTGNTPSDYYSGTTEGDLGNDLVTWERARKTNLGIEMGFFSDRLMLTADFFNEDRSNILTIVEITPGIYGVPDSKVPPANVGKTNNKGYEVAVAWKDRSGNFSYSVEGHVSYSKNKIIYRAEPNNPYSWMNQTGHSIGQTFGYRSDGLFNTLEELAARPYVTSTGNQASLGDVRYVDLNGDGVIDDKDIAPIGYPNYPQYHFGLKLSFSWKGIDLRMLFNGTANGSFYIHHNMANAYFKRASNAWQWQYDNRWTPEKAAAGVEATYPRPTFSASSAHNNYLISDFWMRSNDFIKLKNIELGYTLPTNLRFMKAAGISSFRVYVNANNVFTFLNKMKDMGIDPETTDPGINDARTAYIFPLTRVFNIGLSLQF